MNCSDDTIFTNQSPEPTRLIGYSDHEVQMMGQGTSGLLRAALNEVLLLRQALYQTASRTTVQ